MSAFLLIFLGETYFLSFFFLSHSVNSRFFPKFYILVVAMYTFVCYAQYFFLRVCLNIGNAFAVTKNSYEFAAHVWRDEFSFLSWFFFLKSLCGKMSSQDNKPERVNEDPTHRLLLILSFDQLAN